jgi:hypothetical protein
MSLVPNQVHIQNAGGSVTLDMQIGSGGQNSVVSTDSLKIQADQTLALKGYDVKAQCGGSFAIANNDQTQAYVFPNPNTSFPNANQVIVFNSDGTSQFADQASPPPGSSYVYTPMAQNLAAAQYNISNVGVLSVAKPVSPGQNATVANWEVVSNEAKFTSDLGIGGFTFDKSVVAPDVSSATYSLETVGGDVATNSSDIATLQQKVADLSAVILSLTGIVIP